MHRRGHRRGDRLGRSGEVELIARLTAGNAGLRHLWGQHLSYDATLAEMERIRHPSEGERRKIARLKRLKLRGKQRITGILDAHRTT